MLSQRVLFERRGFDKIEWSQYYKRHQLEYIRVRLKIIKLFSEGMNRSEIALRLNISQEKVRKYIKRYVEGGLEDVVKRDKRCRPTFLDAEQTAAFRETILHSHPQSVGLSGNIWTGELMKTYIERTFGVKYKSGIFDLLARLGITHQRAHSDYTNADPKAQSEFIESLKNTILEEPLSTAIVFADEFSVQEKPTSYYGWALKNTRPVVPTNEKKTND